MRFLPDPDRQPQFYDGVTSKRLVAWIIDMILIIGVCVLIGIMTVFVGFFFFPLLVLVIGFFYRVATLTSASATWGMRFTGIEFRSQDGALFDGQMAVMHTAGYTISMALFPLQLISVILILTCRRGQGLSDSFLGTVAINKRV
ncbi:MAG: putative RDD family membrane protein YckC [Paracoccaceae bacterium]|jgi:uncharacterized RDD family membrane protein YckC